MLILESRTQIYQKRTKVNIKNTLGAHCEPKLIRISSTLSAFFLKNTHPWVRAAHPDEGLLIPYTNNLQPALPSLTNLTRAANRARQAIQPQDPVDLDFEVNMDYIPGSFLRGNIKVDERRHLIFVTDQMLNILCRAKTWYLDGTFKIIKEPFTQVFYIHAFIKSESSVKQLPLVFVLMLGKRKGTTEKY